MGGTGKTPLVGWLGGELSQRGFRCAIVSRGYRAHGGGDEPEWLKQRTGAAVILDSNRRRAFGRALREGAQIVILDDSLQARDRASLQIGVLLARDLMSPPRVLPAGPARESMNALSRCQLLLVRLETGDPLKERLAEVAQAYCEQVYFFRLVPRQLVRAKGETAELAELTRLGTCLLVSGLARPESFEADARETGAQVVASLRYSDHASFDPKRAREIEGIAHEREARALLCPEKNLTRLAALGLSLPLWALRSQIEWEGEDPLPWVLQAAGAK